MENVKLEVSEGNRLTIEVDLNHRGDISASGKTKRVASTQGNVSVKLVFDSRKSKPVVSQ